MPDIHLLAEQRQQAPFLVLRFLLFLIAEFPLRHGVRPGIVDPHPRRFQVRPLVQLQVPQASKVVSRLAAQL